MDTSPASRTSASGSPLTGKRVVVTTFGSLGDLHPYLAIALGLKSRGHEAVLVDQRLLPPEGRGAGPRLPVRCGPTPRFVDDPDVMRRVMDLRTGLEHRPAAGDPAGRAGVLRGHAGGGRGGRPAGLPPDLLRRRARRRERRAPPGPRRWSRRWAWPRPMTRRRSPATPASAERCGPSARPSGGRCAGLLKRATRPWARPIDRLRADLGLPPAAANPLVDGHSPALHLALFSRSLAGRAAGLASADRHHRVPVLRPGRRGRAPAGPGPVPRRRAAAGRLHARLFGVHGRRAVLRDSAAAARRGWAAGRSSCSKDPRNRPPALPEGVTAVEYAPFSGLFPRAAPDRPPRRGRHHRAGDAVGPSDAGGPLRPRPARQRRPADPAGGRPHAGPDADTPRPAPRPSCGSCSTTRPTRSGRPRSPSGSAGRTAWGPPVTPWRRCSGARRRPGSGGARRDSADPRRRNRPAPSLVGPPQMRAPTSPLPMPQAVKSGTVGPYGQFGVGLVEHPGDLFGGPSLLR